MSNKITGKNLHYDQSLPPFLARLKGQHTVDAGSPDPILASRRRQAKPRSASQDAEDAPLIVDDEGNVVAGVEVAADGTVTESQGAGAGADGDDVEGGDKDGGDAGREVKTTTIGGSKKRKLGKVVGADAEGHSQEKAGPVGGPRRTASDKPAAEDKPRGSAKAKKKAKKIKLSFGDGDGD